MFSPQLTDRRTLRHFLSTEGLPKPLLQGLLTRVGQILETMQSSGQIDPFRPIQRGRHAVVPALASVDGDASIDRIKIAVADPVAAQRFATAANWLHCEVLPIEMITPLTATDPASFALWCDALLGDAPDVLIVQHPAPGMPYALAQSLQTRSAGQSSVRLINAGDGGHADPVTALAAVSLLNTLPRPLTEQIVMLSGDVGQSGLARSCIHALTTLGVPQVRVAAPPDTLPIGFAQLGVHEWDALDGVDAQIVMLAPQSVQAGLSICLADSDGQLQPVTAADVTTAMLAAAMAVIATLCETPLS